MSLALEVIGGLLVDKKNLPIDEKYWQDAIFALRKNRKIITKIQISYEGLLDNEVKLMFLDIACFMLGEHKESAMEIWESSSAYGLASWSLNRLIDKCLVKVDSEGQLSMHDLIQDMGCNVVIERVQKKLELQSHI